MTEFLASATLVPLTFSAGISEPLVILVSSAMEPSIVV
jgi:hypothetical protein